MFMRYVSLFSGIEAASVAWKPLGWEPVAFSEIEKFPCELLAKRFPRVPNLGDVSKVDWRDYGGTVDLVVGGSPCQAFSVAGKREGLMDSRGQLMLEYVRAVREIRPRWVLWENVPGVLSQDNGEAFATLQDELEQCGYSLAWRVLDAQFFGVAQRRRRVFLVGHSDPGRAAAVLFERESLRWDSRSSREKRESLAGASGIGASGRCFGIQGNVVDRDAAQNGSGVSEDVAPTLNTQDRHAVAGCLNPWDCQSQITSISTCDDGMTPTLTADYHQPAVAFNWNASGTRGFAETEECSPTIRACGSASPVVVMASTHANAEIGEDMGTCLTAHSAKDAPVLNVGASVRRLMPVECERLQGFPDGWTDLGGTPDTPRYKALGNSMAVPVMQWIGERIEAVEESMKGVA